MSLETTIQTALIGCASGGAYQDVAPQDIEVAPFIVWSQIVSTINNSFGGPSNLQNTRVQVDVHATSQAERSAIAALVVAAIAAMPLKSIQLSSRNIYEAEVRLFRSIIDFSVWST